MLPDGTDISWTSADGLTLYAKAYGPEDARLTILCLHGLTRNHQDFEPMIAALPRHHRYVAVDVRGRGRSAYDPQPENYKPPVYAKDMFALLDKLGVQRAALIGTSMGGLISLLMIRAAPKRVSGIVLNDVGPVVEKSGLARIASYAGKVAPVTDWDSAAAAVKTLQGAAFPDMPEARWMDFARRTYKELPSGEVVLAYDPNIARSLGKVKPGPVTNFVLWRLFGASRKAPLLIVRGETSDILSGDTAEKMARRHPDAQLATVPRVGHAPILDEPEAVAAISDFLSRLETKA
ncbi:MAG: alpha/beta hydrolase [Alphaproteobacteria bacterium HGW-Alphaproteobacteria-18]|nr:MAG: alpha/beta hydrolase [Alphaproteobacteria bacterium HGW-Alphaproteobacteria-18]